MITRIKKEELAQALKKEALQVDKINLSINNHFSKLLDLVLHDILERYTIEIKCNRYDKDGYKLDILRRFYFDYIQVNKTLKPTLIGWTREEKYMIILSSIYDLSIDVTKHIFKHKELETEYNKRYKDTNYDTYTIIDPVNMNMYIFEAIDSLFTTDYSKSIIEQATRGILLLISDDFNKSTYEGLGNEEYYYTKTGHAVDQGSEHNEDERL